MSKSLFSSIRGRSPRIGGIAGTVAIGYVVAMFLGLGFAQAVDKPDEDSEIPSVIEGKIGTQFAWVSATASLDPEGEIHHEYFLESASVEARIREGQNIQTETAAEVRLLREDSCTSFSHLTLRGPDVDNVEDLLSQARLVFNGRISAIDQGFLMGTSGSLLKIETERILKSSPDYEIDDFAYVYYPYARFSIGGARFCRGNFPDNYQFKVGDTILVVARGLPVDPANKVIPANGWEVVFENSLTQRTQNNLQLEEEIRRNTSSTKVRRPDEVVLWGDDLPTLSVLIEQVERVLVAIDKSQPERQLKEEGVQ